MKVSLLIARAAMVYGDTEYTAIAAEQWLNWLNEAEKEIVKKDPTANADTEAALLVAGSLQTLAADTVSLMDVSCNLGATGTTVGQAVRFVSAKELDAFSPSWRAATAAATVEEYMYDPNKPFEYEVNPPSTGAVYVRLTRAKTPVDLTSTNDSINLADQYAPAIINWMLHRVFSIDSMASGAMAKSDSYLTKFEAFFV